MTPPSDDWTDDDFRASAASPAGSVGELAAGIRDQLSRGGVPVDELRLFVLARLHQGRTQREVEYELEDWGLDGDYAIELVCSARTAGNFGAAEVSTELRVDGVSAGVWRNPSYEAKLRAAARAARRDREARRLAGVTPRADEPPADLGFEPGLPSAPTPGARRAGRGRWVVLLLLGVGLACGVAALAVDR